MKRKSRNIDELKDGIIKILENNWFSMSCPEITQKLHYKPTANSYVYGALKILLSEKRVVREKIGRIYMWDTGRVK